MPVALETPFPKSIRAELRAELKQNPKLLPPGMTIAHAIEAAERVATADEYGCPVKVWLDEKGERKGPVWGWITFQG